MDYQQGHWQVIDFRFSGVSYAIWNEPTESDQWRLVLYDGPTLVIVADEVGELCFFVHESLVDGDLR